MLLDSGMIEIVRNFKDNVEKGPEFTTGKLEKELEEAKEELELASKKVVDLQTKIRDQQGEDKSKYFTKLLNEAREKVPIVRIRIDEYSGGLVYGSSIRYGIICKVTKTRVSVEMVDRCLAGFGIIHQYMRKSGFRWGGGRRSRYLISEDIRWINKVYDEEGNKRNE